MFDIGWTEMVMIIVVMIIFIGPKDLPRVLHTMGQWVGKMRRTARQFQRAMEKMAEESGLDEAKKDMEKLGQLDIREEMARTMDPKGELENTFSIEPPPERKETEAGGKTPKTEPPKEPAP